MERVLNRSGGTLLTGLCAVATVAALSAGVALGVSGSSTISTVAGTGPPTSTGDGGPATQATLNSPTGVAIDSQGRVLIAEAGGNRVRRIAADGAISRIVGTGTPGFSGNGGQATQAELNGTVDVAADASGNVFVTDQENNRVRRVAPSGVISTYAGNGTPGGDGDGGGATLAQLNRPTALAVDPQGNVYILEYDGQRVRRVSTGGTITTVAGTGVPGASGDGGPAVDAEINFAGEIAIGADGVTLFIADQGNRSVRQVAPNGIITTVAGTGASASGGDGGPAALAEVNAPLGVAQDLGGNVYVSDTAGNRVRRFTVGGTMSTVAGNGTATFAGDGGAAAGARVSSPRSLVVDASGALLVADTGNHRIRRIANLPPSAGFTVTPGSGVAPLDVTFDGRASSDPQGAVARHDWSFGDGAAGVGATVVHRYTQGGTFAATLTVTDDSGVAASATRTVTILPPGAAPLSIANASLTGRYLVSRLRRGRVVVEGVVSRPAQLEARILRASGKGPALAVRRFRVANAGAFKRTLAITGHLLPGRYLLRLVDVGPERPRLPAAQTGVALAAPPEGVVAKAFMSRSFGGRAATRIAADLPQTIFAHFRFAARPRAGRPPLRVTWYWSRQRGAVSSRRARAVGPLVVGFLRRRAGSLGTGLYRAELRSGTAVVAVARIRLG